MKRFSTWRKEATDPANQRGKGINMANGGPLQTPNPSERSKTEKVIWKKDQPPQGPDAQIPPPPPTQKPRSHNASENEDTDGGLETNEHPEHLTPTPTQDTNTTSSLEHRKETIAGAGENENTDGTLEDNPPSEYNSPTPSPTPPDQQQMPVHDESSAALTMDIETPRETNTTPSPPRPNAQVMDYCDIEMSTAKWGIDTNPTCPLDHRRDKQTIARADKRGGADGKLEDNPPPENTCPTPSPTLPAQKQLPIHEANPDDLTMDIDVPRENNPSPYPPRASAQAMDYYDIEISIDQPDRPCSHSPDIERDTDMKMSKTMRTPQQAIELCDNKTKATFTTMKHGLQRKIAGNILTHPFERKLDRDGPTPTRTPRHHKDPTANTTTTPPTGTHNTKHHDNRDRGPR